MKGDKTAFIDTGAYKKYITEAEQAFLKELAKQKSGEYAAAPARETGG